MALKTPGVYIDERNAFPNSVVAVETAVPAFIGYTEKSMYNGQSFLKRPVRIDSFMEFELFYGRDFKTTYQLEEVTTPIEDPVNYDFRVQDKAYSLTVDDNTRFNLYDSMKLFYQNGGGSCFIVSVGTYQNGVINPQFSATPFKEGIKTIEKETEPTLLVIPDAVLLDAKNCYALQNQMLVHCEEFKNKVAILDIHSGDKDLNYPFHNPIDNFRNNLESNLNTHSYGAAYYPWLHTTIVQPTEINYKSLNVGGLQTLKMICKKAIVDLNEVKKEALENNIDLLSNSDNDNVEVIHNALFNDIPDYKIIMEAILKKKNVLPPSAAMAGIYTMVDAERGVWKAPVNIALSSVVAPVVLIDQDQQEDLNAPLQGQSICAIRPFKGIGTMVWGARTLDGDSLDWRYINVRRTMIMLEQSIKLATKAYVFEPNVKNTWMSVESIINNFLTNLWKQGALAGSVPADAFNVSVGLGSTMTAQDVLEGIINIEVKVAISHPAEFIAFSFQQQQQKV